MRTNFTFPTTSKEAISEYEGLLHYEGNNYEKIPAEIMEASSSEAFFKKRMKMLCRTKGFMLSGKMGLTLSPLLNCYIQI